MSKIDIASVAQFCVAMRQIRGISGLYQNNDNNNPIGHKSIYIPECFFSGGNIYCYAISNEVVCIT
jgi:hypothetical protein